MCQPETHVGSLRKPWKNNQRDRHGNCEGHGPPKAGCPCASVCQHDPLGNGAKIECLFLSCLSFTISMSAMLSKVQIC